MRGKEPCIKSVRKGSYAINGRVWVESAEGAFLGHGRVTLLERIKQYGTISGAARSMEMAYRHAWELVDSMNRQAKTALVETAIGGKGGGGTKLTPEGERAIVFFRKLEQRLEKFLEKESARCAL